MRFLDCFDRVAAANDADRVSVCRDRFRDGESALGTVLDFEHSHRSVPKDGPRLCDLSAEELNSFRPNIDAHPAFRDRRVRRSKLSGRNGALLGIDLLDDITVYRKEKFYSELLRFV